MITSCRVRCEARSHIPRQHQLVVSVMPRQDGIALLPPASRKEDTKVLEDNTAKLIAVLKGT